MLDAFEWECAGLDRLFPMPASQRLGDRFGVLDALYQQINAVTAPEQFVVEHHGGHAEHTKRLGLVDDLVMLRACRAMDLSFKLAG